MSPLKSSPRNSLLWFMNIDRSQRQSAAQSSDEEFCIQQFKHSGIVFREHRGILDNLTVFIPVS